MLLNQCILKAAGTVRNTCEHRYLSRLAARRSEPDDFAAVARGEGAADHFAVALGHFFAVFAAIRADAATVAFGEVVFADGGGGVASGAGGEQQGGGEGCKQGFGHGVSRGLSIEEYICNLS